MLCRDCEDLFGVNESEFAREVFHPFAARLLLSANYGSWLRKFSASVCWRILESRPVDDPSGSLSGRWSQELASCRETWRLYLTGKRPDVGAHHLHLMPWNGVEDATDARLHAIGMSVNFTDDAAFVCAKLGPILLAGLIADPVPGLWRGTRINAEGKLKRCDRVVPDYFHAIVLRRATSWG